MENLGKKHRKVLVADLDIFKSRISAYLKNNNMAPSRFERNAYLPSSTIKRILNGEIPNPTIDTILKINSILNDSLDNLFVSKKTNITKSFQ